MALPTPIGSWKVVWFGSAGPFWYDDGADTLDPDLLYDGVAAPLQSAFITDGQVDIATAPALDVNVLRLVDVGTLTGDVIGPGAATDHAVVRWNGITGKLLQNSIVIINDTGDVTGVVNLIISEGLTALTLKLLEKSADPTEPSEGQCIIWLSDGTEKGNDGDLMVASKAGGTTKYGTLFDYSSGAAW